MAFKLALKFRLPRALPLAAVWALQMMAAGSHCGNGHKRFDDTFTLDTDSPLPAPAGKSGRRK